MSLSQRYPCDTNTENDNPRGCKPATPPGQGDPSVLPVHGIPSHEDDPTFEIIIVVIIAECAVVMVDTLAIKHSAQLKSNSTRLASIDAMDLETTEESAKTRQFTKPSISTTIEPPILLLCDRCGNMSHSSPGEEPKCAFCGEPLVKQCPKGVDIGRIVDRS
jgi:hypothetical protein